MTKFLNKSKKPGFWPIFDPISQFLGQKNCLQKPVLSRTTSYGPLALCQNLEKANYNTPRKRPDGWKDGRTEGQTDPIL